MTWHSEYGQDRWLVEHVFGDAIGGTFVEAGALDGIVDSNTLYFERERGWRGVLIEANPALLGRLCLNRPEATIVSCALASRFGVAEFEIVKGGLCGWSGLADASDGRREELPEQARARIAVQTRTLAAVLRECGVSAVDYLSLDVEGAELDVLTAYPFAEIPIRVIGVEDNSGTNEAPRQLLRSRGYEHLARVGVDEFWRRK